MLTIDTFVKLQNGTLVDEFQSNDLTNININNDYTNYLLESESNDSNILDYINDRDGAELQPHVRYPFASKARTDNVLNDYPKIKSIVNRIANEPSVVEWINDRGIQMF